MKRSLTGGLAATAALSPFVVAGTGQAQSPEGIAPEPASQRAAGFAPAVDVGALEGCTAHFGLTKTNSSVILFDETVTGPLTPAPVIGDGITPVATITFADTSTYTCILEPAWTDEESFEAFFPVDSDPTGYNFGRYPGRPGYLLPGTGVGQSHLFAIYFGCVDCADVDGVELELVVDSSFGDQFTVTYESAFDPLTPLDGMVEDVDAYEAALLAGVRSDLPEGVRESFDALVTGESCTDTVDLELEAALAALQKDPPFVEDLTNECDMANSALLSEIFDQQADDNTVDVLIESLEVPVTSGPPTTDSGSGLPDTGSSDRTGVSAWTAGAFALLGAALVRVSRRRRPA